MVEQLYSYKSALRDALKVNWQVGDLIGGEKQLDFSKPFLPESLVRTEDIQCLSSYEKLILNQIRGNSYLHLFVLVEEFIIPMVLEQVKQMGYSDIYAVQALLCFAEEEGKHIHLFQKFAEEFERGFGSRCDCVGPTETLAAMILRHHPLSVLLLTLQFEWTTQSHYLESIRDNQAEDLDPRFCSMLKHHWMEEAQHTKLDTLLAYGLAQKLTPEEIEVAIEDYLKIAQQLDQALMQQVQLDLQSLERVLARPLLEGDRQEIQSVQELAYRWSFLCAGMTHPNFIQVVNDISPAGKVRVIELAKMLS